MKYNCSFKGTDSTFVGFPERLRHIVAETTPNIVVESTVFPAYEVRESKILVLMYYIQLLIWMIFVQTKGELVSFIRATQDRTS